MHPSTRRPALAETRLEKVKGVLKGRGPFSRIEGTYLAADTCHMAKKPEPPKPIIWNVYKIASKGLWLGTVEAPDEAITWCAQ
jgi:hypothetical protein